MERLHNRVKFPTDIYYCLRRNPLVKNPESKYQLIEFITETRDNIIFVKAPLLKAEVDIFNEVYKQHKHLSAKEHNSLLDSLLKESKRSKIACFIVTPSETNTEQVVVVLLHRDSDLPSGNNITRLSSRISKTTLSAIHGGAVDIPEGFPCQWIYTWPFKKVMTLDHLKAIQQAYPHPKTNHSKAECCEGFYQNLGSRTTNHASGS